MLRKIINSICLILVLLMILGSVLFVLDMKKAAQELSNTPGYSGSESFGYLVVIGSVPCIFGILLLLLLEVRHDLLYFLDPKELKAPWKTVFNAGGLAAIWLSFQGVLRIHLIYWVVNNCHLPRSIYIFICRITAKIHYTLPVLLPLIFLLL